MEVPGLLLLTEIDELELELEIDEIGEEPREPSVLWMEIAEVGEDPLESSALRKEKDAKLSTRDANLYCIEDSAQH
jgi:hypothetical protein